MVFGGDHRMGTGTVSHPQASAQVVRIGHAIEHQQQRLHALRQRYISLAGLQLLQQFVQRMRLDKGLDPCHHTLVTVAAAELGQAHAIGLDQADTRFFDALHKLAHAGVAAGGFDVDFENRRGCGFDTHPDGMEAEQGFGTGHKPLSRRSGGSSLQLGPRTFA